MPKNTKLIISKKNEVCKYGTGCILFTCQRIHPEGRDINRKLCDSSSCKLGNKCLKNHDINIFNRYFEKKSDLEYCNSDCCDTECKLIHPNGQKCFQQCPEKQYCKNSKCIYSHCDIDHLHINDCNDYRKIRKEICNFRNYCAYADCLRIHNLCYFGKDCINKYCSYIHKGHMHYKNAKEDFINMYKKTQDIENKIGDTRITANKEISQPNNLNITNLELEQGEIIETNLELEQGEIIETNLELEQGIIETKLELEQGEIIEQLLEPNLEQQSNEIKHVITESNIMIQENKIDTNNIVCNFSESCFNLKITDYSCENSQYDYTYIKNQGFLEIIPCSQVVEQYTERKIRIWNDDFESRRNFKIPDNNDDIRIRICFAVYQFLKEKNQTGEFNISY